MVKNRPTNAAGARDAGLIPGLERSPEVGNGNPLQYSCLENSMDRGAWGHSPWDCKGLDMTECTHTRINEKSHVKAPYPMAWHMVST